MKWTEFSDKELEIVLLQIAFPEGYRLYDFASGNVIASILDGAPEGPTFSPDEMKVTARVIGIERVSDGAIQLLEIGSKYIRKDGNDVR